MAKTKIVDYISGIEIDGTPEELDAVQPFSRRLVEDYGYPKTRIQTRPQFRVKKAPSSTKEDYPLDICIFSDDNKNKDSLEIVIECKESTKSSGRAQLESYLNTTKAKFGVWFNGKEIIYLLKVVSGKSFEYKEVFTFPRYGTNIDQLGENLTKKDLKKDGHLIEVLSLIRSHLVNNETKVNSSSEFASEIIKIIFCKIYDELKKKDDECLDFRVSASETIENTTKRVLDIFENVKREYSDIFQKEDKIRLGNENIVFVVGKLQDYYFMKSKRDIIKDAFEVFVGVALRGDHGQFFTPRNIANLMVNIANPNSQSKVLDPACGSGGFLTVALEYIWNNIEHEYAGDHEQMFYWKRQVAENNIYGIDRERFLVQLTKAYMAIMGDGKSGIMHGNTLAKEAQDSFRKLKPVFSSGFDVVLANPPYGNKITIKDKDILDLYDLRKKKSPKGEFLEQESVNPEVLFTEYIIKNLKEGGTAAILLPEGVFGNTSLRYVREYILERCKIVAVIGLPTETFQPHTGVKTSILIIQKPKNLSELTNYDIFVSMCNFIGHNKNGKPIEKDDTDQVLKDYTHFKSGNYKKISNISRVVKKSDVESKPDLPIYANFYLQNVTFEPNEKYLSIEELFKNGVLKPVVTKRQSKANGVSTITENKFVSGDEVGSENYLDAHEKGAVPFVRTSDIHNMEIDYVPTKHVTSEVFLRYKNRQAISEGDILFVQDGEFLIGECCYIDSDMTRIVIQSHIKVIRIDESNPFGITSKAFLYLLNEPAVKSQLRKYIIKQGTIKTVPLSMLLEVKIRIPDKASMKAIDSSMSKLLDIKRQAREEVRGLNQNLITLN